ncbi:hypothetical protein TCAL_05310 [Tigriopus californicus]|uniref:Uncharacterized protein n=1 Tax=Tigriopus californicus TaxID=6832 RepID=A0A553PHS6_TIGCA|nr:uncharacterized protein LOC131881392 [Tigriopus californicus]TRY77240.1 hypothetical protein TCAL_05310 [Tigriopus californicus]|eukprot:TCALIF_05310-PA protein Name:"Protein of unknown function" AED:0.00 eAED:0.00 QI:84/1/1/1/1/1/3/78/188
MWNVNIFSWNNLLFLLFSVLSHGLPILKQGGNRQLNSESEHQSDGPIEYDPPCILPHLLTRPSHTFQDQPGNDNRMEFQPEEFNNILDEDLDEMITFPERCTTMICKAMFLIRFMEDRPQQINIAKMSDSFVGNPRKYEMKLFAKALRMAKGIQEPSHHPSGSKSAKAIPNGAYFYSPSSKTWEKIRI